jgi:pectin methylesterase-like acyl-CoA thioesterase/lysophospholipase L1-like esterase
MKMKHIARLGAAVLFAAAANASQAACPGGAFWCEDFAQASASQVLLLRGDGNPVLMPAAATSPHTDKAYYVEARLRPLELTGGASGTARRGYLIARYADERHWLGFGLEFTPGSRRLGIEIVRMEDGTLKPIRKASAEIGAPGSFYTVRLDIDGSALTLSVNGSRIMGGEEPSLPAGRIGAVAQGGDFALDDLRIGDPHLPPARLGLVHTNNRLSLQAGEGRQRYPVRLLSHQGIAKTRFTASSSDPAVAAARVDGDALVVTPLTPGQATIAVVSADDNNVAVSLDTSVGPAFATTATAGPKLDGRILPAVQARDVQVDTLLQLRFDHAPTLSAGGAVRIYRARDGALVDVIRAGNDTNVIGASPDGVKRVVRYDPIQVEGTSVSIQPHDGRLAYDTEYYVLVDAGLFKGASLAGAPFAGIGKPAGWRFRTRAHAPTGHVLSVDDDGPADFRTVQGALDHAMGKIPRAEPVTIRIANGRYGSLLYLRGKENLTLHGESRDGAVIAVRNSDGLNPGSGSGQAADAPGASGGRSVFLIEDADLVRLENLTVVNTTLRDKPLGGQAEAINFASEGRFIATDASFISEQDTILVRGWSWFYHTLIAGNVDFIWGGNRAALFEESEIRSLGNGSRGGYIVQARTPGKEDPGFVFLNSRLTHGPGPSGDDVPAGSTTLARPGTATTWDKVSYINCRIDGHIGARGWSGEPRGGAGWYEFNSMDMAGRPLELSQRAGGRVLSPEQAAQFASREKVFAGYDGGKGWNPSLPASSTPSTAPQASGVLRFDFSGRHGAAPLYDAARVHGFVDRTLAVPARPVHTAGIQAGGAGFTISEPAFEDDNHFGMAYRIKAPPGAWAIRVRTTSGAADTIVSISGMESARLLKPGAWDAAGLLPNRTPMLADGREWRFRYVNGREFIDIEVEPKKTGVAVGIEAIELTPIAVQPRPAGALPTLFTLGDSTLKSYTFDEAPMSGWGQVIDQLFDPKKVRVVNYAQGGRSFRNAYAEGRLNDLLLAGYPGDVVMIQFGHNDESEDETKRFGRGATEEMYAAMLKDVYLPAIRARGMIPVLVTPMSRVNGNQKAGEPYVDSFKKRRFPALMKKIGAELGISVVDLNARSIEYYNETGIPAITAMVMSIEAGETPGKTNDGSYANGHPANKIDGTHFKETLAKQYARMVVTELARLGQQGDRVAATLAGYLRSDVRAAIAATDWSAIHPEIAGDIRSGDNAYYRNQIEKLLQLGVLRKDARGNFNPQAVMQTREFIAALKRLLQLPSGALAGYADGPLSREVMGAILDDAYHLRFAEKPAYMTDYNGKSVLPGAPGYDPNLDSGARGAMYYPLVHWAGLLDTAAIAPAYAGKLRDAYELGLIRSEKGIARGSMVNGRELEPKAAVTRAKAAKALYFMWVLGQPVKVENDTLATGPN